MLQLSVPICFLITIYLNLLRLSLFLLLSYEVLMFFFFILGFLLLIFVVVASVGSLIKPARLNLRTKRNPTGKWRGSRFALFLVLLFFLSIFFMDLGASSGTSDSSSDSSSDDWEVEVVDNLDGKPVSTEITEPQSTPKPEPVVVGEVGKPETLGLTPDEFGKRFVIAVKEFGLDKFPWSKVELTEGAVNDTFTKKIRKDLVMTGVVDKNGELKSITYILGKTDDGDQAALTMLRVGGATARVLNPDLPKEQTSKVATELLMDNVKKFESGGDTISDTVVVDGVKYGTTISDMLGLWLYFEVAE